MNKKAIIVIVAALAAAGGAYKFVLAKPKEEKPPKVEGTVYVLQKEFLVNLADERYAKLTAALVLDPEDHSAAGGGGHGAPAPPEGYGPMAQEAIVRSIVTDAVTGENAHELEDSARRARLRKEILERIDKETDVHADDILFPDVTVQ